MIMEHEEIKILLVEDNPADILLLREELSQVREYDFTITTEELLGRAIEAARGDHYDIVLLDLNLPDSAGIDSLTRFMGESSSVPILILTGTDDQITGIEAIHRGAQDYLVKGTIDSAGMARAIRYSLERWRLAGALRQSEEWFRSMFEKHKAIMLLIEPETGAIVDANPAAASFYGHERSRLKTMHIQDINTLPAESVASLRERTVEEGLGNYIFQHRLAGGATRWVEVNSTAIDIHGRKILFSIINDITEKRNAQDALEQALREKELLMKEVHHRVKNNMTIISSLLSLQFDKVSDAEARRILEESSNRIISMQMIYDRLYRSDNPAFLGVKDYLTDLVSGLFKTYNTHSERINLELDIEEFNIEVGKMVSCGLIINELVSNCLKYAFPENRPGNVRVTVGRDTGQNPENKVNILVSDNGVGVPDNFDIRNTSSFGLKLVGLLVKQLNGSMALDKGQGTAIGISFTI